MNKQIAITGLTIVLMAMAGYAAYQGSNGTQGAAWNDQKCLQYPTFNNSCKAVGNSCTGNCQAINYDRACGNCVNAYFGSCQTYTGRVAVVSTTPNMSCVWVSYFFFSVCTCPSMPTPAPSGTQGCQCAT
jgi:hypothetical protein